MNGHGHEFGHEFMSESMSEADSDTDMRLFGTSDTDSDTDMDKVMTSDTDTGSDTHRSDNRGHEFGLGHAFGHAFRHDVRVSKILLFLIRSKFLVGRDPVRSNESVILYWRLKKIKNVSFQPHKSPNLTLPSDSALST